MSNMPMVKQVEDQIATAKERVAVSAGKVQSAAKKLETQTVALARNPQFQTCTLMMGGGAITFGTVGGAFGTASGVVMGGAAGVLPSLLTFGLSIPAGAVLGGTTGFCTGTMIGSSAGGFAGYGAYRYRVEIRNGVVYVKVKSMETLECAKVKVSVAANATHANVCNTATVIRDKTLVALASVQSKARATTSAIKARVGEVTECVTTKAKDITMVATTTRAGVASTTALAGGAVGSTTGGAAGMVAGAAVGVIPAIFTFGLSVPVCATMGMCAGTALGGVAGSVGGGTVGYVGFTYKNEIKGTALSALQKTSASFDYLKLKASEKVMDAKVCAKSIVGSGTGGTEMHAVRRG